MTYAEPPTEDPMELLVSEAEAYMALDEEGIRQGAAGMDMTVAEYRQWVKRKIAEYRSVNPHDLDPGQYRRLFGEAPVK